VIICRLAPLHNTARASPALAAYSTLLRPAPPSVGSKFHCFAPSTMPADNDPAGLVDVEDEESRFSMFFTALRIRDPPDGVVRPLSAGPGLEGRRGSAGAGEAVRSGWVRRDCEECPCCSFRNDCPLCASSHRRNATTAVHPECVFCSWAIRESWVSTEWKVLFKISGMLRLGFECSASRR